MPSSLLSFNFEMFSSTNLNPLNNGNLMNSNEDSGISQVPTNVLVLLNMVTAEQLIDDNEYNEIMEDVQEECNKFGNVVSIYIPRPNTEYDQHIPGIGKVFIEFTTPEETTIAKKEIEGRTFDNRTVSACYYNVLKYAKKKRFLLRKMKFDFFLFV